jgi:hypothetical protein
MSDDIREVEEDSPMRCQANTSRGQCRNEATTKGGMCLCHGGNKTVEKIERNNIRNYNLLKFQAELDRHADSPRLKTLNDEVAILRMMLEKQLNACTDATDLILKSHLISDLVVKIEKLVKSCHNLESSLGGLMDKQAILTFAAGVVEIIGGIVEDEDQLEQISSGVLNLVGKLGQDEEE